MILKVTSFYDGFSATEEELLANLRTASSANLVGERTIGIAVRAGFIDREGIIRIGGVPHAQMYRI